MPQNPKSLQRNIPIKVHQSLTMMMSMNIFMNMLKKRKKKKKEKKVKMTMKKLGKEIEMILES